MVEIIKESKNEIKFFINRNKDIFKELDIIHRISNKKLKYYILDWHSENILIAKKTTLKKCKFCGKKDVLSFEFDDGYKVYKICGSCWIRLNS